MFTLKASVQRKVPVATDIFPSRSEYLSPADQYKITKVGTFLYHGNVPTRAPNKTKLTILHAAHLSQLPWLVHGFSTRVGGFSRVYGKNALNLGLTKDDSEAAVERNRVKFLSKLGVTGGPGTGSHPLALVTLRQVHSDIIRFVDSPGEPKLAGDG